MIARPHGAHSWVNVGRVTNDRLSPCPYIRSHELSLEVIMRKFIVIVGIGFLLSASTPNTFGETLKSKLRWQFYLISGSPECYIGRLMIFYGNIGIGTAYWYGLAEDRAVIDQYLNVFSANDARYMGDVLKQTPHSYFPIIIHYIPYSRPLLYGNISLYGYLDMSFWSEHKFDFYEYYFEDSGVYDYSIEFNPCSWFNIGIALSFNPLRYIPCDLRIGYLRAYYPYYRIPQPYREHIPHTAASAFYISILFSLGYQSAR